MALETGLNSRAPQNRRVPPLAPRADRLNPHSVADQQRVADDLINFLHARRVPQHVINRVIGELSSSVLANVAQLNALAPEAARYVPGNIGQMQMLNTLVDNAAANNTALSNLLRQHHLSYTALKGEERLRYAREHGFEKAYGVMNIFAAVWPPELAPLVERYFSEKEVEKESSTRVSKEIRAEDDADYTAFVNGDSDGASMASYADYDFSDDSTARPAGREPGYAAREWNETDSEANYSSYTADNDRGDDNPHDATVGNEEGEHGALRDDDARTNADDTPSELPRIHRIDPERKATLRPAEQNFTPVPAATNFTPLAKGALAASLDQINKKPETPTNAEEGKGSDTPAATGANAPTAAANASSVSPNSTATISATTTPNTTGNPPAASTEIPAEAKAEGVEDRAPSAETPLPPAGFSSSRFASLKKETSMERLQRLSKGTQLGKPETRSEMADAAKPEAPKTEAHKDADKPKVDDKKPDADDHNAHTGTSGVKATAASLAGEPAEKKKPDIHATTKSGLPNIRYGKPLTS